MAAARHSMRRRISVMAPSFGFVVTVIAGRYKGNCEIRYSDIGILWTSLPKHWESRIGRRLKLRDLHILFAVVQWGSMAKAATHLAMSQPAVSEAIANLEDALRVRLLDRSSRGIEPTIYAHALLKRGHVVFDELRQGIRDIEFLANPTAGEVRVACWRDARRRVVAGGHRSIIAPLSRNRRPCGPGKHGDAGISGAARAKGRPGAGKNTRGLSRQDDLDIEILFDDPHRRGRGCAQPLGTPSQGHPCGTGE